MDQVKHDIKHAVGVLDFQTPQAGRISKLGTISKSPVQTALQRDGSGNKLDQNSFLPPLEQKMKVIYRTGVGPQDDE